MKRKLKQSGRERNAIRKRTNSGILKNPAKKKRKITAGIRILEGPLQDKTCKTAVVVATTDFAYWRQRQDVVTVVVICWAFFLCTVLFFLPQYTREQRVRSLDLKPPTVANPVERFEYDSSFRHPISLLRLGSWCRSGDANGRPDTHTAVPAEVEKPRRRIGESVSAARQHRTSRENRRERQTRGFR